MDYNVHYIVKSTIILFRRYAKRRDMYDNTHTNVRHFHMSIVYVSEASRQVEEVIKNDNFVLSMKHIKPRRRLRGSVETLFAVDFPGSQQKFVLMLDRRSKRGESVSLLELARGEKAGISKLQFQDCDLLQTTIDNVQSLS